MKDRRHTTRWQINIKARVGLEGTVVDVACIIHDLSFNGARISLAPQLPPDRLLKINISLGEGFNFKVETWVVWHKKIMERNVYGVYFSKIKDLDKKAIYKFMHYNFPDVFLKASAWQIPLEIKEGEGKIKERRVFERILVHLPVKLIDLDAEKELEADTYDLSAKGLGIITNEYLHTGDRLELWLDMPDERGPFYTRGCVVWSKLQDTGQYRQGISLEKAELMGMSRVFRM